MLQVCSELPRLVALDASDAEWSRSDPAPPFGYVGCAPPGDILLCGLADVRPQLRVLRITGKACQVPTVPLVWMECSRAGQIL